MAKLLVGAAMVALSVAVLATPGGVIGLLGAAIVSSLLTTGGGLLLAGIAGLLQHNPGIGISIRQSAAPWQIVYGQSRVGGTIAYLYLSNDNTYLQIVIILAAHEIESMDALYLDGKKVYAELQDDGETWAATGGDHYDYANNKYNFDGLVFYQLRPGAADQSAFDSLIGIGDDTFTSNTRWQGKALIQLSLHYSATQFPAGIPGIKCDIRGKNDVLDPRTGETGYTTNASLCIADAMCNADYGFQCDMATEINQAQLIADANLSDEQVLTSQGYEARYTLNGSMSTDSTPGDMLEKMLTSNAGRITYVGGQWNICSGSYTGYTILLDENDMAGKFTWLPYRKYRDQVNAVKGQFVSPCYPYEPAGPGLYDNQPQSDIFNGQWQPTDFPSYAQDALHGYSSDANYAADNNTRLWKDVNFPLTISAARAQRLAKISLLRDRQDTGNGTFKMTAYRLQALDNFAVTFAAYGFGGKVFEIQQFGMGKVESKGNDAPALGCTLSCRANDPSLYAWSISEEIPMDSNGLVVPNTNNPAAPTGVSLDSSSSTSTVNADGIRTPRILAAWTAAADGLVVQYQLQIQENAGSGVGPWQSCGLLAGDQTQCYVSGVTVGASYNVRICSQYQSGAVSDWVAVGPEIVSDTYSSFTTSQSFNDLGNVLPTQTVPFTITNAAVASGATVASTTVACAAYSDYPLPSGTMYNLPAFSQTFSSLALSSTYATMPRYCVATGAIDCPDGAVENGPSADQIAKATADGYIWLNTLSWTTPAAGGSGGGVPPPGGPCPHEDELVRVWNGSGEATARAGDVQRGDWIRGWDLQSQEEVWRRVDYVEQVPGTEWAAVPDGDGFRLFSPFEEVRHGGRWVPAHEVPGAKDVHLAGNRVKITVQAARHDDQNFFIGGLLVHNIRVGKGG